MQDEENIEEAESMGNENQNEIAENEVIEIIPIDEKELAIEQEKKRADELEDRLLRVQAEFDNFRKRMEGRFQEAAKYASENILLKVLEIADNLERAVNTDFESDPKSAKEGVKAILLQIEQLLGREEVRPIDSLGKPFDPYYQHAVSTINNPDEPDGIVIEEYQRGYMLKEKVLRPALVVVNRHEPKEDMIESEEEESPEKEGD